MGETNPNDAARLIVLVYFQLGLSRFAYAVVTWVNILFAFKLICGDLSRNRIILFGEIDESCSYTLNSVLSSVSDHGNKDMTFN